MKTGTLLVAASAVALVVSGGALYLFFATDLLLPPEYRWGREGNVELELMLERPEIPADESLNYTVTMKNAGNERVRIYIGDFCTRTSIFDEDNRAPEYHGPAYSPPKRPDDATFNSMTKVLEPGASCHIKSGSYGNHTTGAGYHDLRPGHTYHLMAFYSCHEDRPYPALPCWQGELLAGPQYFTVRGDG